MNGASGLRPCGLTPVGLTRQAARVRPSGVRPQVLARSSTAPPHSPHRRPARALCEVCHPTRGRVGALDGLADGHAALAGAGVLQVVLDQQQRHLAAERGGLARAAPASHSAPVHAWQRAAHMGCYTGGLHCRRSSITNRGMQGPSLHMLFYRLAPAKYTVCLGSQRRLSNKA